ncbi:hypothetical protein COU16_00155 [Candidatus Kaiserbacteria bacterium CG10_big_fil_rev_8_21_14_0_10_47_16]|uniref:GtrA/DPMS transmembrane domain-containing protein n=1 Tax=Candidatus Kaiserbacteria bacterium CG10_big_fil_rev_8_21_14_0_10_47_16 TaxID=1974608 RepID=A0A2H0UER5_9BACT|nr:MAG: hypothetical protein COU16_00155 [Candidatus Kaiserbacteria bacterium CG10_big_fil_rev_8_21_14_0_10_47_16]
MQLLKRSADTLGALHFRVEAVLGERLFHLVRYLISGGIAATTNVGILFLLVHFGDLHYLPASVLAYLLAIVVSFTLQKFWTFQDKPTHDVHTQFSRYIIVVVMNLLLNTAIMYILVDTFSVWYILAQIVATALVAITGYFAYRHFVFKERS